MCKACIRITLYTFENTYVLITFSHNYLKSMTWSGDCERLYLSNPAVDIERLQRLCNFEGLVGKLRKSNQTLTKKMSANYINIQNKSHTHTHTSMLSFFKYRVPRLVQATTFCNRLWSYQNIWIVSENANVHLNLCALHTFASTCIDLMRQCWARAKFSRPEKKESKKLAVLLHNEILILMSSTRWPVTQSIRPMGQTALINLTEVACYSQISASLPLLIEITPRAFQKLWFSLSIMIAFFKHWKEAESLKKIYQKYHLRVETKHNCRVVRYTCCAFSRSSDGEFWPSSVRQDRLDWR